jgi:hypothetical protein
MDSPGSSRVELLCRHPCLYRYFIQASHRQLTSTCCAEEPYSFLIGSGRRQVTCKHCHMCWERVHQVSQLPQVRVRQPVSIVDAQEDLRAVGKISDFCGERLQGRESVRSAAARSRASRLCSSSVASAFMKSPSAFPTSSPSLARTIDSISLPMAMARSCPRSRATC